MSARAKPYVVSRWTAASRNGLIAICIVLLLLAAAPIILGAGTVDRLTTLFVYVILAAMWNALAGYGGLVSIGQQLFFGLGAYFLVRLADAGLNPFFGILVAAGFAGLASYPISLLMLRLRGGEFAIGMWVLASLTHMLVNLDGLVQGETGTSLISLNAYDPALRRVTIYWLALVSMVVLLGVLFALLRSRNGAALQAIRDNEEAAASLGVNVAGIKRMLFVLAALGTAIAGALWLASAITFQPKTYFGVHWTAYMIFMVLVGGIGSFEGAIIGAVLFFAIETWFGGTGVWYLIGLGATAVFCSLFFPKGIWGAVERRFGLSLLPVGYRLSEPDGNAGLTLSAEPKPGGRPTQAIPHSASITPRPSQPTQGGFVHMIFGKRIVITGAASGIGRRTAELAAAMGAEVYSVDITQSNTPPVGRFIKADISTKAGVEQLVAQLPDRIDGLCNVAGLSGKTGAVATLSVNFYGLRALVEAAAGKLREGASVVNIASIAGYGWRANLERAKAMVGVEGFPDVGRVVAAHGVKDEEGYPVSKELLILWSMRAAHQSRFKGRGIRINAVSPGPVETPILQQFREVLGDARVDSDINRCGRAGTSEEIAPIILFLCSDAARWINGANIPVDGGLEASVNADVLRF
jgi:branched-chain amino acid transport system permease protein